MKNEVTTGHTKDEILFRVFRVFRGSLLYALRSFLPVPIGARRWVFDPDSVTRVAEVND